MFPVWELSIMLLPLLFGATLGSVFASALHCLAERDVLTWGGRSRCDSCNKALATRDLVPIFSYLLAKGKTRCCHVRLSPLHGVVEGLGAAAGAGAAWICITQGPVEGLLAIIVALTVLYTFSLDIQKHLISLTALLPAAIIGVTVSWLQHTLTDMLWGVVIGGGVFLLQYAATKGKGIGSGDIFLGVAMGLTLGAGGVFVAITIGYIVGSIHALILLALKKATRKTHLALGAYLSIGWMLTLTFKDPLLTVVGLH